jgi:hypothetical protein
MFSDGLDRTLERQDAVSLEQIPVVFVYIVCAVISHRSLTLACQAQMI